MAFNMDCYDLEKY